jgi:integrase
MHLYQHGMDLTLVSQWLGHANLETTLIYAYADTEQKRQAITRALGHSAAPGISLENYAVTDEELLKRLYGL